MKTSHYLNFVLTIIAIAMIGLFFEHFDVLPTAQASPRDNIIDVRIVGVNTFGGGGAIGNHFGSLKVEVTNPEDFSK